MNSENLFDSRNRSKLNLSEVYNQPDPRLYFSTLAPLHYMIPENAKPVFASVFDALRETRGLSDIKVLDLGCSYGVNAALHKYGLTMEQLYDHYTDPQIQELDYPELIEADLQFLDRQPQDEPVEFTGVDSASNAIQYAKEIKLLDDGVSCNLERTEPSRVTCEKLQGSDIIITTGCVGYVTENTFAHILDALEGDRQPWVASFVLRMFPYDEIDTALDDYGLTTEKLDERTFIQRNFASAEEQDQVLKSLVDMGISPEGKEELGQYHAEFFLSRPRVEAQQVSVNELLEGSLTEPS